MKFSCDPFSNPFIVDILRELLFNPDNLCMDTYIRSFMDVAGFIPVALTLNYPNVAAINAFYDDILNRLQEVNGVSRLEFDAANETVRLKEGWEMVNSRKYVPPF